MIAVPIPVVFVFGDVYKHRVSVYSHMCGNVPVYANICVQNLQGSTKNLPRNRFALIGITYASRDKHASNTIPPSREAQLDLCPSAALEPIYKTTAHSGILQ